jgi:transcriptional regulator of met regulon
MPNDVSVTVRIPASLKKRLTERAREGHRSLSAQVLHDLEAAVPSSSAPKTGRFLGLYAGTPLATDADIREVRRRLWGRLNNTRSSRPGKPTDD